MIIATAGHIDHGKTLLINALTGVDTDRLPEEKKRGMTIDLGFAYLPLVSGKLGSEESIGFIDVPGHERFMRNMLCGVAGIDFVLLVIAADDGPMPQTRAHLEILDLLEVRAGAVVLTKVDRVSTERVAEVRQEVARLIAGTTLADAPVFAVSAMTGSGIGNLKDYLTQVALASPPRATTGNFRLAVDRCFSLPGAGLVVTGTVVSGSLAVGDPVLALIAELPLRTRSIHAQNNVSQFAKAGQRCGLNLSGAGLKNDAIVRGDWIVAGDAPPAVRRIDARLRIQSDVQQPLEHWTTVHVHLGAADVVGRVAVLEGKCIQPGSTALVQLVLDRAIGAVHGDRLIVRDQSSQRTIGGGRVIDIYPPAKGRAKLTRLEYLAAMETCDQAGSLKAMLDCAGGGIDFSRFCANRNLNSKEAAALLADVPMVRLAAGAGLLCFAPLRWNELRKMVLDGLAAWHERSPDTFGPSEDRILHGADKGLHRDVVAAIAAELTREGVIVRSGGKVRLPSHRPRLSPADEALWRRIDFLLEKRALRPPSVHEIADALDEDVKKIQVSLDRAARRSVAIRVSPKHYLLPSTVCELGEMIQMLAAQSPNHQVSMASFRDKSGIGRNLSVDVLEFFDRSKFTRRVGNVREVLRPLSDVFLFRSSSGDL